MNAKKFTKISRNWPLATATRVGAISESSVVGEMAEWSKALC